MFAVNEEEVEVKFTKGYCQYEKDSLRYLLINFDLHACLYSGEDCVWKWAKWRSKTGYTMY